jgi:hypothetical protein
MIVPHSRADAGAAMSTFGAGVEASPPEARAVRHRPCRSKLAIESDARRMRSGENPYPAIHAILLPMRKALAGLAAMAILRGVPARGGPASTRISPPMAIGRRYQGPL